MDTHHMPNKVWNEIFYPFPNFNDCTVEVWEWISNFISQLDTETLLNPHHVAITLYVPREKVMVSHFFVKDIYFLARIANAHHMRVG